MNSEFSDISDIEAQLAGLRPVRMDADLTRRLEGLVDGGVELGTDELALEHALRGLQPLQLSPQQFAAFAALIDETPAATVPNVVANVVEFPAAKRRQRPLWASAAAVAVLGAFTAMMLPNGKSGNVAGAAQSPIKSSPSLNTSSSNIVPAGFNRGVQSAQDQGVIWNGGRGSRVVRVEYLDKAVIKQKDGKQIEVQQPRVEYLVVPENVD